MPHREPEPHDPRLYLALKGMVMVIAPGEGNLILDKTLSELSGVDVRALAQTAARKKIPSHA